MTTTNIPYFSIRLLTVFSYFLPFIFFLSTCTSPLTEEKAYNKEDAIRYEKEKTFSGVTSIYELIDKIETDSTNSKAVINELHAQLSANYAISDNARNIEQGIETRLLLPTDYSLSGIGSIYYHKNIIGKITIGLSLLLSLITLILWTFINKKKIVMHLLFANILVILIFIIDCLVTNVSLLFGVGTLLFLITIQLLTEIRTWKA